MLATGAPAAASVPTASQLVTEALSPKVPPFAGTVHIVAHMGLSALLGAVPGAVGPSQGAGSASATKTATGMLSGSHYLRVWQDGPSLFRLAVASPLSETDIVRNHSTLWIWNSRKQQALRVGGLGAAAQGAAMAHAVLPATIASRLLAKAGRYATITVQGPATIAGQRAYVLSVAPRQASSLVRSATVAVDAANGMVLQVQVTPKGSTVPAASVGFTSLQLSAPSASMFSFSPPAGSSVRRVTLPAHPAGPGGATPGKGAYAAKFPGKVVGSGWARMVELPLSSLPASASETISALAGHGQAVPGLPGARLVTSSLYNALIVHGYVVGGAVSPRALEQAAAALG